MSRTDCPECGGDQSDKLPGGGWRCGKCGSYFEAGRILDYDDRDPSRRLMRKERKGLDHTLDRKEGSKR